MRRGDLGRLRKHDLAMTVPFYRDAHCRECIGELPVGSVVMFLEKDGMTQEYTYTHIIHGERVGWVYGKVVPLEEEEGEP